MKKIVGFLLVFMFVVAGLATNAGALGIGGYFTTMSGSSEWDVDLDADDEALEDASSNWDAEEGTAGFGFVLDTAVARDQLFNYRFQIGLESSKIELELPSGVDATAKLSGLAITNDFGVGVVRTKNARVWIGPELRLAFKGGNIEFDDEPDNLDIDDDWTIGTFQYGIGPVVGGNFHIGNALTLAVKTGVIWETMTGKSDLKIESDDGDDLDFDLDYESSDVYFFITFSVFYRLGDTF